MLYLLWWQQVFSSCLFFTLDLKNPQEVAHLVGKQQLKAVKEGQTIGSTGLKKYSFIRLVKKPSLHKELMLQEKRLHKRDCFWHGNMRIIFGIVTLFRSLRLSCKH